MPYTPDIPAKDFYQHTRLGLNIVGSIAIVSGIVALPFFGWPFLIAMVVTWAVTIWAAMTIDEATEDMEQIARHSFFIGAYAAILAEHPASRNEIQAIVSEDQFRQILRGARAIQDKLPQ